MEKKAELSAETSAKAEFADLPWVKPHVIQLWFRLYLLHFLNLKQLSNMQILQQLNNISSSMLNNGITAMDRKSNIN